MDLFFVLSGLLITGILFDAERGKGFFSTFYKRRALRIFPVYFAFWALVLVVKLCLSLKWPLVQLSWVFYLGNFLPIVSAHRGLSPDVYASLWLNNAWPLGSHPAIFVAHFWSLCVEEQFYLVWPAVVWFCRSRRTLMRLCVAGVIGTLLLRITLEMVLPSWLLNTQFLYETSLTRADSLLMGAWLALYLRRGASIPARHAKAFYYAGAGALAAFVASAALYHTGALAKMTQGWLNTYGYSLLGVISLAVLVATIRLRFVQQVLMWRPLLALGKVSYGFYVLHCLSIGLLVEELPKNTLPSSAFPSIPRGIAFFAATWLVSAVSFRFFEQPFLRLKDRWAPAREVPVAISSMPSVTTAEAPITIAGIAA